MAQQRFQAYITELNPHFHALFEKSLDAVVGMNMSGHIIAWNSSAAAMFGWTAQEAIGTLMSSLIVPHQHRSAHNNGLKTYAETRDGPVLNNRVQITALRRDGNEFPIELSILPIKTGTDTVFYAFIRNREDEERLNSERELRTREAEILAAISAAHLENMETDAFIRLCLERICQVSGWSVGHFYRFDNPRNPLLLVPSGVWHISDPEYQTAADVTDEHSFSKGEGLPGSVWASETAIVMENIPSEVAFFRREAFLKIGLTKGFAFPLRNCGNLSGVMEFFGPDTARSGSDLIRFADIVGSHVELALQRKSDFDLREMLRRELSHRVGNSLAVLSSLFRRCAAMATSVDDLRDRFEPRLIAVAHAHRMIAGSDRGQADLHKIVGIAAELLPEADRVSIEGPEVELKSHLVLPLTMILHELVTNTVKYGIWQSDGTLTVKWRIADKGSLQLIWRETPAQETEPSVDQGYGSVLMQAMAEGTMNGQLSRGFEDGAYVAKLDIPLA